MKKIVLLGNPNCGKTSLFNALTGMNQKVGNFSGVTVDRKSASIQLKNGETAQLTDLPGSHSLSPTSLDEQVVHDVLIDPMDADHPDLVVLVLNASALSKSLFIATQVIDLNIPVLIVLNLIDVAERKGIKIDAEELSKELNAPVISLNARKRTGVEALEDAISKNYLSSDNRFFQPRGSNVIVKYSQWLRQSAADATPRLSAHDRMSDINNRYRAIDAICKKVITQGNHSNTISAITQKLDAILLHRVWGLVAFLVIFFLLFQAVFTLAAYPMDWIDTGMAWLSGQVSTLLPDNMWSSFIVDGVLSGLNGVVIFLPQIMILFGLISVMENSGYMARASFLNDKLLGFAGMNGKSIVPLVGGFACAVPAIMAARSIGNAKSRLITILITPLMSCSARLPVYIFLISFIVPDTYFMGVVSMQALFMLGLYLLGIAASMLIAWALNKGMKTQQSGHFILELPEYQSPRWKDTLHAMVNKGRTFVLEAGKIILMVSVILWALASFAPGDAFEKIDAKYSESQSSYSVEEREILIASEKLEASYAGKLGHYLEPAIRPLGFDWKIGIALVTSFAAREVFVGTMATIYGLQGDHDGVLELRNQLMNRKDPLTGKPVMTLPVALSLVVFYVFAMQCMSTLAVVKKETGGWKWPLLQFLGMTALAYLASFICFQLFS